MCHNRHPVKKNPHRSRNSMLPDALIAFACTVHEKMREKLYKSTLCNYIAICTSRYKAIHQDIFLLLVMKKLPVLCVVASFNHQEGVWLMAKAKRYSTEQIQAAQKQLCALTAKKSGKTKKEVVALLAEDVCKAVKEGHSLKDIQETLRQSDIPVSLARLKALLGETEAGGLHTGHGGSGQEDTPPPAETGPA
ncbi:hypothetical protein [Bilophila wadsworthia]|uniref:hypothetical protein n=1 Tax=Bilophila wadsworthia TaxID=35833 RepID=UPI00241E5EFF|nr:hypothetical protein [Bilophila wadsworthia]